jgi:hypothetical protein
MTELYSTLIVMAVIVIVLKIAVTGLPSRKSTAGKIAFQHYYLVGSLHSKAELAFDRALYAYLGPEYRICPKVRLSDIAKVRSRGVDNKIAYGLRKRCDPRHADWIITHVDGTPICWIELDDKSHNSAKAQVGDKFKNDLAHAIGIPLARFRVGENYKAAFDRLPL